MPEERLVDGCLSKAVVVAIANCTPGPIDVVILVTTSLFEVVPMKVSRFLAGARNLALLLTTLMALTACGSSHHAIAGTSTYSISGAVTGSVISGVTVTLSGAASKSTTTDASGKYSFAGLANGSYTITPSLNGYTFSPATATVTVSGGNVSAGTSFTASVVPTHSISGTVSGAVSSGVTVSLSGATSTNTTTDANGNYSFTGLADGSYTVTPSLGGYTFSPSNTAVTVSGADVGAISFTATAVPPATYSISGTVSGAATSGVTVTLSGAASATTTTDSTGAYSFAGLQAGSYTVTPSLTGYTFNPTSTNVTVASANVTVPNFTATQNPAPTYTLSGTVTGPWVEKVVVSLSGASSGTTQTDASGHYSFTNLPAGTYTVTPALPGYTYSPAAPSVTLSANTTQDFAATSSVTAYGVSGSLSYAGTRTGRVFLRVYNSCCSGQSPVAGTSVALTGSPGAYTGSYTIHGLQPGSYLLMAEIDTLGNGEPNAANPSASANVSISGASQTSNLTLADPSGVSPAAPSSITASPGSGSALIQYQPIFNANNQEMASSYTVSWGTDTGASNGGSKTFSAQGPNMNVLFLNGLTNGQALYFKMTASIGATISTPTPVFGPVTINATSGANTVTGTVTFPGTATGPLLVGVYSNNGVYFTTITSPVSPQSYSVAGVPNGTYQNFAVIDQNNNGMVDVGDITNVQQNPPTVVVSGNTSVPTIVLDSAFETVQLANDHWSDGTNSSYSLNLGTTDGTKRAVAVTVFSGPNIAVPFDLGASTGNNVYEPLGNPARAPSTSDVYQLRVSYSDGTTQDLQVSPTAPLNSFATNLVVNTASPYSRNVPQFQWSAPTSPPASYEYYISVSQQSGGQAWYYPRNGGGMPSSQLSVPYNADNSANPSSLTSGTPYSWQVIVRDAATRNTATFQAPGYTP